MSDNKIEFTNDTWEYRVVRQKKDGDEWLSMQEVYSDEDGKPYAHSIDLEVTGDSLSEIRKKLQSMLWAIDKDIVDEIQNDVMEDDMERRMLAVEMENAELRDRLTELGDMVKEKSGNIYESPDGGETVYSRKFGETERTKVTEKGL